LLSVSIGLTCLCAYAGTGLSANMRGQHRFEALDATVVDVYRGAHGAVFMVNPFSEPSLDYVRYAVWWHLIFPATVL
jgi:hypothetical protein